MSEGKVDRAKTLTMAAMEGSNKQAQSVHCVILARFEFCSGPKKKACTRYAPRHRITLPLRRRADMAFINSWSEQSNQFPRRWEGCCCLRFDKKKIVFFFVLKVCDGMNEWSQNVQTLSHLPIKPYPQS